MSTIIESLNGEISVVRIDGKLNKEQHRRLENESDLQVEITEWNRESSEYLLAILKNVSGLKIADQGFMPKILAGKMGHLKCLILDYCVNASNIDFAQFNKLEKLVIGTNSINWDSLIKCQECIGIEFQEVNNYGNADLSMIQSLKKLSFESVKAGTLPKGISWDTITHFNLQNYKGKDFIIPDTLPSINYLSIINSRPNWNQFSFMALNLKELMVYNWKQFGDIKNLQYSKSLCSLHIEKCDIIHSIDILKKLKQLRELVITDCTINEDLSAILSLSKIERLRINAKGKYHPPISEIYEGLGLNSIGDRLVNGEKPKPKHFSAKRWWEW